jgi:DNA-binding SARP family transcriptional activator
MEFRMLGPVGAWHHGARVHLGRAELAKVRCMLAVLLRTPGVLVTTEALTDRVWDGAAPSRYTRYKYVSWLRSALAPYRVALIQQPQGYLLQIDAEQVDLHHFRRLAAEARQRLAAGHVAEVARLAADGLRLWHGRPLAGLSGSWVELFRDQLECERHAAMVLWAQAELELGNHHQIVEQIAEWESEYPNDEDIIGLHVVTLNRCGRPREALACYRRAQDRDAYHQARAGRHP